MKAVILAGGLGTRMRPLTFSIPKPLLPFGEKPIIENAILTLARAGVQEVVIALGYMPEMIRAYCRDGAQWGVKIHYVTEERALGTAGPLALARDFIAPSDDFILMNGDIVTDLDFAALVAFHKSRKLPVTMAVAEIVTKSPFGVVEFKDGLLRTVIEKPERRECVNAGIYAVSGRCLDLIPKDTFFTMPDLMSALVAKKEDVGVFPIEGFWRGLESRENFDEALAYLNAQAVVSS
jgi:NDP-sugar pyrophosphorylase family protein